MFAVVVLFLVALAAGALGSLAGTGSSLVLLPILVLHYGPRVAVPVMAVAAVLANVARVAAWRREIHWPAVLAYAVPGAPAAVLGAPHLCPVDRPCAGRRRGGNVHRHRRALMAEAKNLRRSPESLAPLWFQ
jgi:hypothetical protein